MASRCLILCCSLWLAACRTEPVESLFDGYLEQLAELSGAPVQADAGVVARVAYPRPRDRRQDVPEVRGGLLDIVRLAECGVAPLIVERNTILGRYADDAALLGNSGALLRGLVDCAERLAEDAAADDDAARKVARIDDIVAAKQPALQALLWNASFGSEAMGLWWRRAGPPLAPGDDLAAARAAAAQTLRLLRRALDLALEGASDEAQAAFSQAYRRLETAQWGGAWLQAAERALRGLAAADHALQQLQASAGCADATTGGVSQGTRLQAVYEEYYAGRIRPYVTALEEGMEAIADELHALWAMQQIMPTGAVAAFREGTWRQTPESLSGQLRLRAAAHARRWETVLAACAETPA